MPSFRPITFEPGFNIILADRTKESTKRDTRNALGKSTLIEIIHFCLGASAARNQGLRRPLLRDWTFTLELEIQARRLSVSRETDSPGRVYLDGELDALPLSPEERSEVKASGLRVDRWTDVLGEALFGLTEDQLLPKYSPSFRSLIPYFVRRDPGGFLSPFTHFRQQREWNKQVNGAFLIDLEWRHAAEWQELKDRKSFLDQLERGISEGLIGEVFGTLGELEAERVHVAVHVTSLREQLESLQVLPEYERIESEADALTRQIHSLSNENYRDRRSVRLYEEHTLSEELPGDGAVRELYEEAGIVFAPNLGRRLDEVDQFHAQVALNRRQFLANEINRLQTAIAERLALIERLSSERSELLRVLQEHGALAEYQRLQERLSGADAQLRDLEARIARIHELTEMRRNLTVAVQDLLERAIRDYDARVGQRERAITLFAQNTESLYRTPGKLIIDVSDTGFRFDVEIPGSESHGINSMKIFAFDLMLAQLWSSKPESPRLLVHDSALFDGVDARQVALALELAVSESDRCGFQYICTMNSDAVPTDEFSEDFAIEPYVRRRLTDVTEDGTLLGIRF